MVAHSHPIREIARQAGVSEATVDRVLHGRAGVREGTAAQVRQAHVVASGLIMLLPTLSLVSMVQDALNQLEAADVVVLDDERRAAMVSNLMVVLCGDQNAQPVVNTGSLYA